MKHGINTGFWQRKSLRPINLALGVSLFFFCGCGYKTQLGKPEIVGERTKSTGEVSEQIIKELDTSSKEAFFTPEGPRPSIKYRIKYFLQEKDKPRLELAFVSDKEFHFFKKNNDDFQNCDKFLAVENSSLWVAAGIDPNSKENTATGGHTAVINGHSIKSFNGQDLHIVVFDGQHILVHRTFTVIPKWESSEDEFKSENGNRVFKINSTIGLQEYDVIQNTVTNLNQNLSSGK